MFKREPAHWRDAESRFAWLLAGLGLLAVVLALLPAGWAPRCFLHTWTGLPCCTCGGTRALRALLAGQVSTAFYLQPLLTALSCAAVAWLLYAVSGPLFGLRRLRVALARRGKLWLLALLLALVALNWGYLLAVRR
jgi:hypothetical protein